MFRGRGNSRSQLAETLPHGGILARDHEARVQAPESVGSQENGGHDIPVHCDLPESQRGGKRVSWLHFMGVWKVLKEKEEKNIVEEENVKC